MSELRRRSRRSGCRRNRAGRVRGGGGMGYNFGASVDPTNPGLGNGAVVNRYPSCDYAPRPGYITPSPTQGGLPGFAGGARSRRNNVSSDAAIAESLEQTGGARYTFEPEVVGPNPIVNHPSIPCDAAVQNQLNKGDVTSLVTAVPAQAVSPTPGGQGYAAAGGRRVGGVDSMVYEAPRAGYTFVPSNHAGGQSGVLADGQTPFAINQPYSAQPGASSACLKTGGGSRKNRKSRKSRKATRKDRKNRKGSRKDRKSRKATRKDRKNRKGSRKSRKN